VGIDRTRLNYHISHHASPLNTHASPRLADSKEVQPSLSE